MKWRLALGVVLFAGSAHAQPSRADALFEEGRKLMNHGRFEQACQKFEASEALEPSIGALLNLGDCAERRGKLLEARALNRQAQDLAASKKDNARADFAAARVTELDAKIPRLKITTPPGMKARLDGTELEATGPIRVDPGTHVVDVVGHPRMHREVNATRGDIEIVFEAEAPREPSPPARPAATPPRTNGPKEEPKDDSSTRTLGIALGAAGGVALAVGLGAGVYALSQWKNVTQICPDRKCPDDDARRSVDDAKNNATAGATVSTVSVTVAALLLGFGGYFFFSSGKEHKVAATPVVSPTFAGLSFTASQ